MVSAKTPAARTLSRFTPALGTCLPGLSYDNVEDLIEALEGPAPTRLIVSRRQTCCCTPTIPTRNRMPKGSRHGSNRRFSNGTPGLVFTMANGDGFSLRNCEPNPRLSGESGSRPGGKAGPDCGSMAGAAPTCGSLPAGDQHWSLLRQNVAGMAKLGGPLISDAGLGLR